MARPRAWRRSVVALLAAALAWGSGIVALGLGAETASASTYGAPGSFPEIVPAGACTATVVVAGGGGGTGDTDAAAGGAGGAGGQVGATIPVVPGTTLTVNVGGKGGDGTDTVIGAGGFNGGAAGGSHNNTGGFGAGGGGRSQILAADGTQLVVAGGGGGGGGASGAGDVGGAGGAGTSATAFTVASGTGVNGTAGAQGSFIPGLGLGGTGGGGGTGTGTEAGGTGGSGGGTGGTGDTGAGGYLGAGGGSGGGGGGFFGGGGGGRSGAGSGGGGGSSFVVNGATGVAFEPSATVADGSVSITYNAGSCGSITIVGDTVPDDAQDFSFATTGTGLADFTLDDDLDGTVANSRTFTDLVPGSYSVTQGSVAGWSLTDLACDAGGSPNVASRHVDIAVAAGQHVTCTFTNSKNGSITIFEDSQPDSDQDFAFTTSGSGVTGFSLDDDADATLSNTQTFADLAPGSYSMTESSISGWAVTALICDTGEAPNVATRTVDITLDSAEAVTCTFTNNRAFASGSGAGGGTFTVSVPSGVSTATVVVAGGTGGAGTSGAGGPGGQVTATIPVAECTTLTVKVGGNGGGSSGTTAGGAGSNRGADGGVGGTGDGGAGGGGASEILATDGSQLVVAGGGGGAGGNGGAGNGFLAGGSGGAGTSATAFTVAGGTGRVGAAGSDGVGELPFNFFGHGGGGGTGTTGGTGGAPGKDAGFPGSGGTGGGGASTTFGTWGAGGGGGGGGFFGGGGGASGATIGGAGAGGGGGGSSFVVNGATGVTHSSSSAGGSAAITFNGGSGSCGSITIVKDSLPDDGQDFSFTATGSGLSSFNLDDDADGTLSNTRTFTDLMPGSFTITEGSVAGWSLTDLTCNTGESPNLGLGKVSITLIAHEDVICTFTNSKQGSITIVKDSLPDDAQNFSFTTTGTGLSGFSLDDDADGTLSNTATFTGLNPGSYSITEGSVSGWSLTGLSCDTGESPAIGSGRVDITLAAGENVTCTFTNTQRGSITIVNDNVPDVSQDFEFTTTGSGLSTFHLEGVVGYAQSQTFSNLSPGSFSVTESGPVAGWSLTALSCNTGETPNLGLRKVDITLAPGENVTCTFTNTKHGSITIVKDANPDHGQDFGYTRNFGAPFTLDDDGNAGNGTSNTVTFGGLLPNTYVVAENSMTDWDLASISCNTGETTSLPLRQATIDLSAGENVTCTFTNTKLGSITIVKDAVPDDGQDFSFTTTGTGLSGFSLDDDTDGTLSNTKTFNGLLPGSFSVTEGAVAGWGLNALSFNGLSCDTGESTDTGTRTATITLAAGEDVTCTFTNFKHGSITIVKDSVPNHAQDFDFTGDLGTFSLDDDNDATLSNTKTITNIPNGFYTVTESAVSGWALTGLTCDDETTPNLAGRSVTIGLSAGENVTCTFTNTQRGSITIVKDAVPNAAQDFSFTTTGTGLSSFDLDDDSNGTLSNTKTFSNLTPGSFSVTEAGVAGWDLTGLVCSDGSVPSGSAVSITLDPGENVTCTFTNTQRGSITIVKDAVPNAAQDFAFTTTGTGLSGFDLDDDSNATLSNTKTFSNLAPGSFSVTEGSVAGWSLTSLTCDTGESPNLGSRTVDITLDPGENVTCTFTNTKLGSITIVKDAVPDDGQDFSFTTTGTWLSGFSLDDDSNGTLSNTQTFTGLLPGSFSVTEGSVSTWSLTGLTCDTGESPNVGSRNVAITLSAGEDVTCTFTNSKQGSITIVEDSIPNAAKDFSFTTTGSGLSAFDLDDDSNGTLSSTKTFSGLLPGSFSVTESSTGGWELTDLVCDTGESTSTATRAATISLSAGENVMCTFTNTKLGSITIVKDSVPDAGKDFSFTTTGSGLAGFDLDDDSNGTLSNTKTFSGLLPGSFSVTEGNASGWQLTYLVCDTVESPDVGTRRVDILLSAGEDVTCTFTNTKLGSITIAKDSVPDAGKDFSFTTTGTGLSAFDLDDDSNGALSNTKAFSGLLPGSFSVTESNASGWQLTDLVCDTGESPNVAGRSVAISLTAGEDVTCTFTNTKLGSITIVKDSVPNAGKDFSFTTTGTGLSAFDLDDDSDGALSNTQAFTGLLPGSFSVKEGSVGNWQLTDLVCDTGESPNVGTRRVDISLSAGEDVTCTFTNTKLGSITIVKDSVPNAGKDFSFTTTGTGLSAFDLDDDSNGALSNTKAFSDLLPGSFSVKEGSVGNWQLTDLVCDTGESTHLGTRKVDISLSAGEDVTCTFTNTKLGSITIIKDALPDAGRNFEFTTTGTGVSPFTLDDDSDGALSNTQVFGDLLPGPFSFSEDSARRWRLADIACDTGEAPDLGTRTVDVTLEPGEAVTCTFTNQRILRVIADDQSVTFGDPDPAFTFQVRRFIGSDTVAVLDTPPTCGVAGPHSNLGLYPITCSGGLDDQYVFSYRDSTLEVTKAAQTITFGALTDKALSDGPFTVAASASSGLAVSFSSATPSVCSAGGPNGSTITLLSGGVCTVHADQAGDGNFEAAPTVARSFTVSSSSQSAPTVDAFGSAFLAAGSSYAQIVTVHGAVTGVSVDYGDGGGPVAIAVDPLSLSQPLVLSHIYSSEGSYVVVVNATGPGGSGGASAFAHVFVSAPGVTGTVDVADGETRSVTVGGVTATLHHVGGGNATVVVVSLPTASATTRGFAVGGSFFDVRVIGAGILDSLTVVFPYAAPAGIVPTLQYSDASGLHLVAGSTAVSSSFVVTPTSATAGTITVVFDATSTPTLQQLGGTVFRVGAATDAAGVGVESATAAVAPTTTLPSASEDETEVLGKRVGGSDAPSRTERDGGSSWLWWLLLLVVVVFFGSIAVLQRRRTAAR